MVKAVDPRRCHAWCLFRSRSQHFAVRVDCVSEIVPLDRLVRLPYGPPELLGLCSVRRDVIPVFDAGDSSATAGQDLQPVNSALILQAEQGAWGLGIHREGIVVDDPRTQDDESDSDEIVAPIEPVDELRRGDTTYTVIHPEKVWIKLRASVERWYHHRGPAASELAGSLSSAALLVAKGESA